MTVLKTPTVSCSPPNAQWPAANVFSHAMICICSCVVLSPLQAQAHTMDKYLPQSLQDEAAASSSAREAAAADAKPHKPQTIQHVPLPPVPTPISPVSCQPMVPKTTPAISLPSQLGQPYITPMPVNTNSLKQQATAPSQNGWTAEAGKSEQAQGFKRPIESTADVGLSHSIGQIEKGLDMLRIDGVDGDDDLEAPSSFCCPITTVSHAKLPWHCTACMIPKLLLKHDLSKWMLTPWSLASLLHP